MDNKQRDEVHVFGAKARVGTFTSTLKVESYWVGASRQEVGFDFTERVFDGLATHKLPGSRVATFGEELRHNHCASAIMRDDRSREAEFIIQKLKEAYGSSSEISVQEREVDG